MAEHALQLAEERAHSQRALADEAVPDRGFFAVKMPTPGQVAFHQGSRLMYTEALGRGVATAETSNRTEPPKRALEVGDAMAHSFLGYGFGSIAANVWLSDDARGSAAALSGVLGRGVWKR